MNFFKGLIVGYLLRGDSSRKPGVLSLRDHICTGLIALSIVLLIFGGPFLQIISGLLFITAVVLAMTS